MTTQSIKYPTLVAELWQVNAQQQHQFRTTILVLTGTLLLTLSAKVQIPFYPVPMTMQTFVVLVLGIAYGWKMATMSVLFYLLMGAFGFPIFAGTPAKGIGFTYIFGPTGGYLFGFLVASFACGLLAERGWGRNILSTFAAMLVGNLLIYACGVTWLALLIGWSNAMAWGVYPFLWSDLAKIVLALLVIPGAWKAVATTRARRTQT